MSLRSSMDMAFIAIGNMRDANSRYCMILAQFCLHHPDKGRLSADNRSIHVNGADPIPCHKLAFRERFFDLGREVQKPGVRVADKWVFIKAEIFNYCLYIHKCSWYGDSMNKIITVCQEGSQSGSNFASKG